MTRYRLTAIGATCAFVTLGGCVNADDTHSGQTSSKGDNDSSINIDVTSDGGGTHSVNGSIRVKAGQKSDDASTVNGSIHIDDNATVTEAQTVNGSIGVGAHASAASLHTVNGAITLGAGASVAHAVSAVNGTLTLNEAASVGGALDNVNGHIFLKAAHVGGEIKTVNGDIDVGSNSHVDGGILVEKAASNFFSFFRWGDDAMPRIVIRPGAVVQGNLRFERPVRLYVSDRATIGPVTGATAVVFSGDNPPG